MTKRARTRWKYGMVVADGALIRVGWVHNASYPKEDTVRLQIKNSDKDEWDTMMTPLEAITIASGLSLVVADAGWFGRLPLKDWHTPKAKR